MLGSKAKERVFIMKKIILVAETGSDVNAELAKEYGVEIVPMHVSFDNETLDDGTFPVERIVEYYQTTGKQAAAHPVTLKQGWMRSMPNIPMPSFCIWHILQLRPALCRAV